MRRPGALCECVVDHNVLLSPAPLPGPRRRNLSRAVRRLYLRASTPSRAALAMLEEVPRLDNVAFRILESTGTDRRRRARPGPRAAHRSRVSSADELGRAVRAGPKARSERGDRPRRRTPLGRSTRDRVVTRSPHSSQIRSGCLDSSVQPKRSRVEAGELRLDRAPRASTRQNPRVRPRVRSIDPGSTIGGRYPVRPAESIQAASLGRRDEQPARLVGKPRAASCSRSLSSARSFAFASSITSKSRLACHVEHEPLEANRVDEIRVGA